jgi:hypothetical protein
MMSLRLSLKCDTTRDEYCRRTGEGFACQTPSPKRKEAACEASGPKSREETPKEGMATTALSHRNNMRVQRTKIKRFFMLRRNVAFFPPTL